MSQPPDESHPTHLRSQPQRKTRLYGVAAPSEGQHLEPGTRAGDYVIEGHLADGGMASVYHATHPLIGKQAAVKVLSAALAHSDTVVARFLQEARAVNQIRHPNIVDIFAFGQIDDGRYYLVMEKLEGTTLLGRLEQSPVPLDEAVDILVQICEALDAAHAHAIAHLDLKPENVFLVPGTRGKTIVKLLDFGIAKLLTVDSQKGVEEFCGTPDYASPEQARGLGTVDHRSDVYSMGVVAYELLVGRRPFEADTPLETLFKHISDEPPRPSSLHGALLPELEQLILRMMSKDPAARPSMDEVRERLLVICPPVTAHSSGQLHVVGGVSGPIAVPTSRRWWMVGAAIGLIVGIAFAFRSRPAAPVAHADPPQHAVVASPPQVVPPPTVAVAPPPAPKAPTLHHSHHASRAAAPARNTGSDYVLDYSGKPR